MNWDNPHMSDLKKISCSSIMISLICFEFQQNLKPVTMTEGLACQLYHLQESQLKNNKEISCPPVIYPLFRGTLWFMRVKVVSYLSWNNDICLSTSCNVFHYVQCHLKSFGPILTTIGMISWILMILARITDIWYFKNNFPCLVTSLWF